MKHLVQKLLIALMLLIGLRQACAQGTAFTYQGRLNTNGTPANGFYDFVFALFNAPGGGSQIGSSQTNVDVGVTNGLFTVTLNFGAVFTGNSTWLAISVRSNGVGTFAGLTPLQQLDPTPYAIFANTASNLSGTLPAGDLSGTYPDALTLNNGANVFVGNGNGLTDLNAANLSGSIPSASLPANVALLNAPDQTFTGSNVFTGAGQSFIVNTGPISTNLFTGLSLQYYYSPGESALQSSYNDGFSSMSFWTKQGSNYPIDRQVFIDRFGDVTIDYQNANSGVFNSGTTNGVGLVFGSVSGEGIASERQAGGNQYGLDFYTDFANRMAITHGGFVGIGLTNPATALQVNGTVTATAFVGGLATSNLTGTLLVTQLPGTVVTEFESGVTLSNITVEGLLNLPLPATVDAGGLKWLYADDNYNTFDGLFSGNVASSGYENTGIGAYTLTYDQTGILNAAEGYAALWLNTTGSYDTAQGAWALAFNASGSNNTAVGYQALENNTNGYANVAVGVNALQDLNSGSANYLNTAVGTYSFPVLTAGADSTGLGAYSAYQVTNGYYNTGIGAYTLYELTNGSFNTALGTFAGYYNTSGSDNIYIGSYGESTDNNVTRLGLDQTETFISSWDGAFIDGVLSVDGSTTNNGMVYQPNVGSPFIGSGEGPFIYGYDGGALGTVFPYEVSLAWNFAGNVWCSNNFSTLSLTIRGGADLAEPFNITSSKDQVPDGSVVIIDEEKPGHLKMSSQPYDTRVAGILSGANGIHPAIEMQQEGVLEGDRNVALSGRVYVQADTSNGPIKPGDLLTTSSAPGRAMKVTDHLRAQGAILGKAMSGLSEGNGMVLVLVTLQ
jgi:hypothetical protein